MGVLACDRQGCGDVMCDYYSHKYGYICDECLDELKGKAGLVTIEEFMDSYKESDDRYVDNTALIEIEEEFKYR